MCITVSVASVQLLFPWRKGDAHTLTRCSCTWIGDAWSACREESCWRVRDDRVCARLVLRLPSCYSDNNVSCRTSACDLRPPSLQSGSTLTCRPLSSEFTRYTHPQAAGYSNMTRWREDPELVCPLLVTGSSAVSLCIRSPAVGHKESTRGLLVVSTRRLAACEFCETSGLASLCFC